jgi:uncharacterized protein YecT (DUF1311 family)
MTMTRRRGGSLRVQAVLLCGLAAGAAPAQASDCKDGGSNQSEMNICAAEAFDAADAALNATYKKIMACVKAGGEDGRLLLDAQRAWLRYRDAQCKFQGADFEGGSAQPMIVSGCLRALTLLRIKELTEFTNGDPTCGAAK